MKNGWKLLAAGAAIGAAVVGAVAYRKYQDRYELLEEVNEAAEVEENAAEVEAVDAEIIDDDFDFEPVREQDDDFFYYEISDDQILFEE